MGKYSIGIGGHVDLKDQDMITHKGKNEFIYACLECVKREVLEETGINVNKNQKELRAIGFLNDDLLNKVYNTLPWFCCWNYHTVRFTKQKNKLLNHILFPLKS